MDCEKYWHLKTPFSCLVILWNLRNHTPMDVDTDPFSFYQMRDQLDGTQQANSNYEENKSSCSRSHSSTQSFEEKSEESPESYPKLRYAEI